MSSSSSSRNTTASAAATLAPHQWTASISPNPAILKTAKYELAENVSKSSVAFALSEFIDNSISSLLRLKQRHPKHSPKISLVFHEYAHGKMRVLIEDNGMGMSREDLISFATMAESPADRGVEVSRKLIDEDGDNRYVNVPISKFGVGAKYAASWIGQRIYVSSRAYGTNSVLETVIDFEKMRLNHKEQRPVYVNSFQQRPCGEHGEASFLPKDDALIDNWLKSEADSPHFARFVIDGVQPHQLKKLQQLKQTATALAGIYHRVMCGPHGRGSTLNDACEFLAPKITIALAKSGRLHDKEIVINDFDDNEQDAYIIHSNSVKPETELRNNVFRFSLKIPVDHFKAQTGVDQGHATAYTIVFGEIMYFPLTLNGESAPMLRELQRDVDESKEREAEEEKSSQNDLELDEKLEQAKRDKKECIRKMFSIIWHGRLIPLSTHGPLNFMEELSGDVADVLHRCHGFLFFSDPLNPDNVKLEMQSQWTAALKSQEPVEEVFFSPNLEAESSPVIRNKKLLRTKFREQLQKWVKLDASCLLPCSSIMPTISSLAHSRIYDKCLVNTERGVLTLQRFGLASFNDHKKGAAKKHKELFLNVLAIDSLDGALPFGAHTKSNCKYAASTHPFHSGGGHTVVIGFTLPLTQSSAPEKSHGLAPPLVRKLLEQAKHCAEDGGLPLNELEQSLAELKIRVMPLRFLNTAASPKMLAEHYRLVSDDAMRSIPKFLSIHTLPDEFELDADGKVRFLYHLQSGALVHAICGYSFPGTAIIAWTGKEVVYDEKSGGPESVQQTVYRIPLFEDVKALLLDAEKQKKKEEEEKQGIPSSLRSESEFDDEDVEMMDVAKVQASSQGASAVKTPQKRNARSSVDARSSKRSKPTTVKDLSSMKRDKVSKPATTHVAKSSIAKLLAEHKLMKNPTDGRFTPVLFTNPGLYDIEYRLSHKLVNGDRDFVPPAHLLIMIHPKEPNKFECINRETIELRFNTPSSDVISFRAFDEDKNQVVPCTVFRKPDFKLTATLSTKHPGIKLTCSELQASDDGAAFEIRDLSVSMLESFNASTAFSAEPFEATVHFFNQNKRKQLGSLKIIVKLIPGDELLLRTEDLPNTISLKNGSRLFDESLVFQLVDQFGIARSPPPSSTSGALDVAVTFDSEEKRSARNKRKKVKKSCPLLYISSDHPCLNTQFGRNESGEYGVMPCSFESDGSLPFSLFECPAVLVPSEAFVEARAANEQHVKVNFHFMLKRTARSEPELMHTVQAMIVPSADITYLALTASADASPSLESVIDPAFTLNLPPQPIGEAVPLFVQLFDEGLQRISIDKVKSSYSDAIVKAMVLEINGFQGNSLDAEPFVCGLTSLPSSGRIDALVAPKQAPERIVRGLARLFIDESKLTKARKAKTAAQIEDDLAKLHRLQDSDGEGAGLLCNFTCSLKFDQPHSWLVEAMSLRIGVPIQSQLRVSALDQHGNRLSMSAEDAAAFAPLLRLRSNAALKLGAVAAATIVPSSECNVAVVPAVNNEAEVTHWVVPNTVLMRAGAVSITVVNQGNAATSKLLDSSELHTELAAGPAARVSALLLRDDGAIPLVTTIYDLPARAQIGPLAFHLFDAAGNPATLERNQELIVALAEEYPSTGLFLKNLHDQSLKAISSSPVATWDAAQSRWSLPVFVFNGQEGSEVSLKVCIKSKSLNKSIETLSTIDYRVIPVVGQVHGFLPNTFELSYHHRVLSQAERRLLHPRVLLDQDNKQFQYALTGCSVANINVELNMNEQTSASPFVPPASATELLTQNFHVQCLKQDGTIAAAAFALHQIAGRRASFRPVGGVPHFVLAGDWTYEISYTEKRPHFLAIFDETECRRVKPISSRHTVTAGPPAGLRVNSTFSKTVSNVDSATSLLARQLTLELVDEFKQPVPQKDFASPDLTAALKDLRHEIRQAQAGEAHGTLPQLRFTCTVAANSSQAVLHDVQVVADNSAESAPLIASFYLPPPFQSISTSLAFTFANNRALLEQQEAAERQLQEQRQHLQAVATAANAQRSAAETRMAQLEHSINSTQSKRNSLLQTTLQQIALSLTLIPAVHAQRAAMIRAKFDGKAPSLLSEMPDEAAPLLDALKAQLSQMQDLLRLKSPANLPPHFKLTEVTNRAEGLIGVFAQHIWVETPVLGRALSHIYANILQRILVESSRCPAAAAVARHMTQSRQHAELVYLENQNRRARPQLPFIPANASAADRAQLQALNPRLLIDLIHVAPTPDTAAVMEALYNAFGGVVVLDTQNDVDSYRGLLRRLHVFAPTVLVLENGGILRKADNSQRIGHNQTAPTWEQMKGGTRCCIQPSIQYAERIKQISERIHDLSRELAACRASTVDQDLASLRLAREQTATELAHARAQQSQCGQELKKLEENNRRK